MDEAKLIYHREYQRKWYHSHKDTYRNNQDRSRKLRSQIVAAWKEAQGCQDCLGNYPYFILDFDHVPERGIKKFNIGSSVTKGNYGIDTLIAEMLKCDVVCANCHRIRTHMRKRSVEIS